jgi:hypothetical protein
MGIKLDPEEKIPGKEQNLNASKSKLYNSNMKRFLRCRLFVGLITAILGTMVLFGLWAWAFAWRRLPYYVDVRTVPLPVPIMTGDAYSKVINTHPRPYIVEIEGMPRGAVLLYGATHTKDPQDSQIRDVRNRWARFRPTIALCESRLGVLFPGLMDPVKTFSEPGAVHALARKDGIPTYTWEPPSEVQVAALLTNFSREQVALRFILAPYFSNLRFGKPDNPEAFVEEIRGKRSRWSGIENVFASVNEIQAAWIRHFPNGPDWKDVSDEFGLPGFLAKMDTNRVRDEHFARVIVAMAQKGERIFAVAGLSHAVKLDAALRAALETEVASN